MTCLPSCHHHLVPDLGPIPIDPESAEESLVDINALRPRSPAAWPPSL
jgi:hypothetical protein